MKENDAFVKDMVAAAIAWVVKMSKISYIGVKVITGIVNRGVPTHNELMENLASVAKSLQDALPKVLEYVCDKKTEHDF